MKIFLSWSGDRSRAVAIALRNWLPLVLHYAKPWLSSRDISAGERWTVELAAELDAADFGIVCLTQENMNAPWVLFEAGALSKKLLTGRVSPYLVDLDVSQLTGPLAQFQAKKTDMASTLEMLSDINAKAVESVAPPVLEKLFGALWPQFEGQLAEIPRPKVQATNTRSQSEVLEELVTIVRANERAIRRLEKRMELRDALDVSTVYNTSVEELTTIASKRSVFLQVNHPEAALKGNVGVVLDAPYFESLAAMVELPLFEYGKSWFLIDQQRQDILAPDEFDTLVSNAKGPVRRLIVSDIPF